MTIFLASSASSDLGSEKSRPFAGCWPTLRGRRVGLIRVEDRQSFDRVGGAGPELRAVEADMATQAARPGTYATGSRMDGPHRVYFVAAVAVLSFGYSLVADRYHFFPVFNP